MSAIGRQSRNLPRSHAFVSGSAARGKPIADRARRCYKRCAVLSRAFAILEQAIADHAFPGAACSVVWRGEVVAQRGFGRFTYDAASSEVKADTAYDLASLTKVVATTPAAMLLHDRGALDVEAPVVELAPEFDTGDARRRLVTVRMLLAHSSGLPGYVRLFETCHTREELVLAAMRTPLEADPGARAEYSDIGFIILGEILARVAGEPLNAFCRSEIFCRLLMNRTLFWPAEQMAHHFPPTEDDRTFRRHVIQGEANDENAWVMDGVAGHAGLFSNAGDVARLAQCLLKGGAPILRRETVEQFTRRETSPPGTSRALGFDTPSPPSQSGQYFGARAFGHLGYTGTSLWIDPDQQLAVTLLTNRTWPHRESKAIQQVRPRFHDAIVEALR